MAASTALWFSLCFLAYFPSDCSPQTLILATDYGIKTLSVPTSTVTTLHRGAATAVDFRYKSREIYFISNSSRQILYSLYGEYYKTLLPPAPRVTSPTPLSSLAVDWVSYRLYYGSPVAGSLFQETLRESTPEELVSQVFELNNFALDPYKRMIFFTTQGHLFSVTLDGAVVDRHLLSGSGLGEVTALALDLHSKEVFVVCRREADSQWVLVTKSQPSAAGTTTVYVGEQLQRARALAVYNGLIFWAGPCGDDHCLYSCQREACQEYNITVSWRTFEVINDVKFYSPLVQTPDTDSACNLCSHGCSQDYTTCACPQGMEIGDDGTHCTKTPPSWTEKLQSLMDGFVDGCSQLYDSTVRPYVYPCGGLVLAVLLCGLCLLATIPCSTTRAVERDEELSQPHPLSERHHPHCPRRHIQPLDSIEE